MDLKAMGIRIKAERKRQKLTIEQLAEKIGISRNFMWEIQEGKKAPAIHTLVNIGRALDISIDYLLNGVVTDENSVPCVPNIDIIEINNMLSKLSEKDLKLVKNTPPFYSYIETD
jgi:transcriptional regulator with XRE-family HTH domain